jgi:glycine/D-amino acid oxidase-like deaminating enzyme
VTGADLADKIGKHAARIAVIGQGYVGLPLAVECARARCLVIGLDTDADRVAALTVGRAYSPDVTAAHAPGDPALLPNRSEHPRGVEHEGGRAGQAL